MGTDPPGPDEFGATVRRFLAEWGSTGPDGDATDGDTTGGDMTDGGPESRARRFQAARYEAGLAGLTWPAEHGGRGYTARYQEIYDEEAAEFDLDTSALTITLEMCLPTLLTYGTGPQKDRFIRPALRGAEVWCELFSEPGGTSDLAGVRTEAVSDGDHWVVNGRKAWASGAQDSDFGLLLARTAPDRPRHQDLTMFILDLRTPGVTIRPLRQMNGAVGSNDVFFEDVHVPAGSVLGQLHGGWPVVMTTLEFERAAIGAGYRRRRAASSPSPLEAIAAYLALARGEGVAGNPVVRQRLAELFIRSQVAAWLNQRLRAESPAGDAGGPRSSLTKLARTEVTWLAARLGTSLAGPAATAWASTGPAPGARWAYQIVSAPASGIAGGTSEVMRTIIGERLLGLPKEPRLDPPPAVGA